MSSGFDVLVEFKYLWKHPCVTVLFQCSKDQCFNALTATVETEAGFTQLVWASAGKTFQKMTTYTAQMGVEPRAGADYALARKLLIRTT